MVNYLLGIKKMKKKSEDEMEKIPYDKRNELHEKPIPIGCHNGADFLDQGDPKTQKNEFKYKGKFFIKSNHPKAVILGAELYEKIGDGKKVIPKLYNSIKRCQKDGYIAPRTYDEIIDFIERNQRKKSSDLEGRAVAVIASAGILGGIVVSSAGITGNVVSDITSKTNSLIGLGLIAVGIIALIIYEVRKKKPVLSRVNKKKVKKSKKKSRKR